MKWILPSLLFFGLISSVWAQGNPPFRTDDVVTTEKNHWDIDLGFAAERSRSGDRAWQAPSVNFAYGLSETFELSYGLPLLIAQNEGEGIQRGLGDSVVGVKWRFMDNGKEGWAVSVNPQVEFTTLNSSRRRGLVENNTAFILPFQIQKTFGPIITAFNLGRTFHTRHSREADAWLVGIAAGRDLSQRFYAGVELYGELERNGERGYCLCNVGAVYAFNDCFSLFGSVGQGFLGAQRPDYVGLLGVHYRR